jgi:hypothetical protein
MIEYIKPATEAEYFYKSDFTGEIIDPMDEGLFQAECKIVPNNTCLAQINFDLHFTHAEGVELLKLIKHKLHKNFIEDFNKTIDEITERSKNIVSSSDPSFSEEDKKSTLSTLDFVKKIRIDS